MRWFIILSLLFITGHIPAPAQEPFMRHFWLNENYTPVNVYALIQDSAGYLWIGTDEGLYRFNGKRFMKIQDSIGQPVTALAIGTGEIWTGYKNGAWGSVRGRFQKALHTQEEKVFDSRILCIRTNTSGDTLWIGSEDGIAIISKDTIRASLNMDSGLSDNFVYSLCPLPGNRLLAGTDNGINDIKWEKGKPVVQVFTTKENLPDNIVRVIRQVPGKNLFWVGMQQGGIALYDATQQTVHNFEEIASWPYGQVNDILPLSGNRAWISTQEGYLIEARLDNRLSLQLKAFHYPGQILKKLVCDYSGNIWCATKNGLCLFTPEYVSHISLPSPYGLKKVTAMACDKNGSVWLAQNRDLYYLDLNAPQVSPQLVYQAPAAISCLYNDRYDRLWIGTMGKGLWYRSENGSIAGCEGSASLRSGNVLSIAYTPGRLWVSTLTGVDELSYPGSRPGELQSIRHHNKQSGIGSDYVYFLFPDHRERLWMATDGAGVCMLDNDRYHHWKNPDGFHSKVAYSITEDIFGDIWVGTYYKGLYHFNHNNWEKVAHKEVSDANISAVTANASGQVFAVYERCIDQWYPNSRQFRHFNYRLEIGIDSTSDVLNCLAKDSRGNVYIPFENGLLVFSNLDRPYDIRPGVYITDVTALPGSVPASENRFSHNENYISFKFEGVNFTNPERFHYRYMLKGHSDNWIYTRDESVTFPKLPPGDYVFRVQVSLDNNFESANEDNYAFRIGTPLWKRIWFVALCIILLLWLIYRLIKLREKRQKELTLLQQEGLSFEYEHLKSQVNPHFLFNSLNTLTNLIEEDQEAAVAYTERLADLYKNILAYRHKELIPLREEVEILSAYLFVQQSRFGEALQVHFSVSEEVMNTKKIIPMALQMLVENAIKHNVVSLAQPLKISIVSDKEKIVISNPLHPKVSKEKGTGLALINIRKRYSLLTGEPVTFGIEQNAYVVTLPLL